MTRRHRFVHLFRFVQSILSNIQRFLKPLDAALQRNLLRVEGSFVCFDGGFVLLFHLYEHTLKFFGALSSRAGA